MDLGQKIAITAMVIGAVLVIVMGRQPQVDIIQNRRKTPRGPRVDPAAAHRAAEIMREIGACDKNVEIAESIARGGAR